jgi:hypothetical protein
MVAGDTETEVGMGEEGGGGPARDAASGEDCWCADMECEATVARRGRGGAGLSMSICMGA